MPKTMSVKKQGLELYSRNKLLFPALRDVEADETVGDKAEEDGGHLHGGDQQTDLPVHHTHKHQNTF